jgi:hypothetical protein
MLLAGRTPSKFRRFAGISSAPNAAAVQSTCARIGHTVSRLFASRPKECLELTARVVRETGGEFRPGGEHGDTVEVGSIIIQIDCGFSPATMSVEIGADSKYPDNQWYAIAARAGYALTGDPVASIEKAVRRCLLADLTSPNRTSEADQFGRAA